MVNPSHGYTFDSSEPKYTVESIHTKCPWCHKELIITFMPNESHEHHQSKRCQYCYRTVNIRVSGRMITISKKDAKGTIVARKRKE